MVGKHGSHQHSTWCPPWWIRLVTGGKRELAAIASAPSATLHQSWLTSLPCPACQRDLEAVNRTAEETRASRRSLAEQNLGLEIPKFSGGGLKPVPKPIPVNLENTDYSSRIPVESTRVLPLSYIQLNPLKSPEHISAVTPKGPTNSKASPLPRALSFTRDITNIKTRPVSETADGDRVTTSERSGRILEAFSLRGYSVVKLRWTAQNGQFVQTDSFTSMIKDERFAAKTQLKYVERLAKKSAALKKSTVPRPSQPRPPEPTPRPSLGLPLLVPRASTGSLSIPSCPPLGTSLANAAAVVRAHPSRQINGRALCRILLAVSLAAGRLQAALNRRDDEDPIAGPRREADHVLDYWVRNGLFTPGFV
ncbi:hypothetical protein Hte_012493 [Hypoxylon texense]